MKILLEFVLFHEVIVIVAALLMGLIIVLCRKTASAGPYATEESLRFDRLAWSCAQIIASMTIKLVDGKAEMAGNGHIIKVVGSFEYGAMSVAITTNGKECEIVIIYHKSRKELAKKIKKILIIHQPENIRFKVRTVQAKN